MSKIRLYLKITIIMIISLSLVNCATMFNKNCYLTVNSNISGATVYLNGQEVGHTPLYIKNVPKMNKHYIEVEHPGYYPQTFTTTGSISPYYWLNIPAILFYVGLVGLLVEPFNDSMYEYNPNIFNVELEQEIIPQLPTINKSEN